MKSFAQWNMDRPRNLERYEEKTHPQFVSKYAGIGLCFEDIYQILKSQTPDGWSLAPGDILLDLGCGTGWYARRLSIDSRCRRARIMGIDISENALELARKKQEEVRAMATVTYCQADLLSGIPAESAREIWFCGAWHQMKDVLKALNCVAGVLSSDGLLHIQTYCVNPQVRQPIDIAIMELAGHHVFKRGEVASCAKKCGLKMAACTERGMVQLCTMRHA